MDEIVAGATVQREYPGFQEHHLFPRQRRLREQFEAIGINVDAWTILVDPKRHAEAHGDQATYGPGGHWNHEWRDWFASPVEHSFRSAFAQAWKMINSHRLAPYGLLAPYGCGRTVAHDLYDIVEPPR